MVSVIVPIYNVESYLKKCITSICCQTYKDIEIILINDGSTDKSGEICREMTEKDSRIRLIEQSNKGLSAARNAGLDIARGEYIAFVDSDDYIRPIMIETMLRIIGNHDMAMCRYSKTDLLSFYKRSREWKDDVWNMDTFWTSYYNGYREECVVAWNKLYKASVFQDYRFSEGRIHEDEFMINHIMQGNRTIALCDSTLYYYIQHPGSIMTNKIKNMDFPAAMEERIKIFHSQKRETLAQKSVLYALYDLGQGNYLNPQKKQFETRIFKLGLTLEKTPGYFVRLIRRRLLLWGNEHRKV